MMDYNKDNLYNRFWNNTQSTYTIRITPNGLVYSYNYVRSIPIKKECVCTSKIMGGAYVFVNLN